MKVVVVEPGFAAQTKGGTPMIVRDGLAVVGGDTAWMTQRDYEVLKASLPEKVDEPT